LKTININLAGEFVKLPKKIKKQQNIQKDQDINSKTKVLSMLFVFGACIVFIASFGLWLLMYNLNKKAIVEFNNLKAKYQALQLELSKSTTNFKNLENEKKILSYKKLAIDQINKNLIPWSSILLDISNTVPQNVKITEISKTNISKINEKPEISIKGIIASANPTKAPLETVSYFILNINENHMLNSTLTNAEAKDINFDPSDKIFKFEIKTNIVTLNNKTKIEQKIGQDYEQ